ncbi:MAG: membrane lipoprotein lipid attachment site-containing protein [Geodermatophilaceae bacterium]|nr:membrane lipoprotein lipid attachment site-containing protein [Geodermatophilaceae bacterium]
MKRILLATTALALVSACSAWCRGREYRRRPNADRARYARFHRRFVYQRQRHGGGQLRRRGHDGSEHQCARRERVGSGSERHTHRPVAATGRLHRLHSQREQDRAEWARRHLRLRR